MTDDLDPAVAAVLQERARRLARPPQPPEPEDTIELIEFTLGTETYGLEAARVRELFRLGAHSSLPGAEPPIGGVAAHRGSLITLLQIRPLLGLPEANPGIEPRVLVIDASPAPVGLLVDDVLDLRRVVGSTLRPAESVASARVSGLLMGITNDATIVLDVDAILQLFFGKDVT